MKRDRGQRRDGFAQSDAGKSRASESGGLSATGLSSVRRLMVEFDELPAEVRAALSAADQPSDQMIGVLCTMNRSGYPAADLLKVIAASNKTGG